MKIKFEVSVHIKFHPLRLRLYAYHQMISAHEILVIHNALNVVILSIRLIQTDSISISALIFIGLIKTNHPLKLDKSVLLVLQMIIGFEHFFLCLMTPCSTFVD